MIVLNDPKAVHELFHKKGALLADRPMDDQWIRATNGDMMAMMPYSPVWRAVRKIAAQMLTAKNLDGQFAEIQEAEYEKLKKLMR